MLEVVQKVTLAKTEMKVASIWDEQARQQAVTLIAEGKAIGLYSRTVCTLFGKGDDTSFVEEVIRIKGEKRKSRPL